MLLRTLRHIRMKPIGWAVVMGFCAIVTLVLCLMEAQSQKELLDYEQTRRNIKVDFSVTQTDGKPLSTEGCPVWVADIFLENGRTDPNLWEYLENLNMKSSLYYGPPKKSDQSAFDSVVGITSQASDRDLEVERGGGITWFESYDESILMGNAMVCLVPEGYDISKPIRLAYEKPTNESIFGGKKTVYEYTLKIVGTYYSSNNSKNLYCPWNVVAGISGRLNNPMTVDSITGTVVGYETLEAFRADAAHWFVEPDPLGKQTEWGKFGYKYYQYAIDIKDEQLQLLTNTLNRSLTVNRIIAVMVLVLSAGAGFFVGFLMIRSRKHEIILMRTLGNPGLGIFLEYLLEQLLSVGLGVSLGGFRFGWEPRQPLLLFAGIYILGLTAALAVFLRKNLLRTMKEDE